MAGKYTLFAVAAVLLSSDHVSAKLHYPSRAAMSQAQAMANAMGGGYGGGMASGMANAMGGGYGGGMASGMADAMASGMDGGMASSSASSMAAGMGGMSMASASASASATIGAIQTRWNNAQGFCNNAMSRVANFIAKIEEVVLGLPLTVIKAMMGIPIKVIQMALVVAQDIVPLLNRAKILLGQFFQTVFELPAKSLYGTISIFSDLTAKILDWGQTCHGMQVCNVPPPNIGGYGPCGGRWPCTRVVGCQSTSCFHTARALVGHHDGTLDKDL